MVNLSTHALAEQDELASGRIYCSSQKPLQHKLTLEFYSLCILHAKPLKESCTASNELYKQVILIQAISLIDEQSPYSAEVLLTKEPFCVLIHPAGYSTHL